MKLHYNLLTAQEAATHLGWALGTLYNRANDIGHSKRGGRLWFKVEALNNFKAAEEIEHIPATRGDDA